VRYQHRPGGLTRQVEARLLGNADVFARLASDLQLPAELRRVARRRVAMDHYKLAMSALRDGRMTDARRHAGGAWLFPERALPSALVAIAARLPARWIRGARGARWATRTVVAPLGRPRRVLLRSPAAGGSGA
jgi:hypothetical protein